MLVHMLAMNQLTTHYGGNTLELSFDNVDECGLINRLRDINWN